MTPSPTTSRPATVSPSSPRTGIRVVVVLALLVTAGAAAWWFLDGPGAGRPGGESVGGGESDLAGTGAARADVAIDPFAPSRAPLSAEEAHDGLTSRLPTRRLETLRALLARGAASADVAGDLEALFKDDDNAVSLLAKAAAMKVAGDRRHLREIADAAVAHPDFKTAFEALDAVDPATGRAFVKALAEAAKRQADPALGALPGLEQAIAEFERDGKAGAAALVEALRAAATPEAMAPWLTIASGLRPIPPALSDALAERVRSGTPAEKIAVASYFGEAAVDFSAASPSLERAIVDSLVRGETAYTFQIARGLSKFPSMSAEAAAALGDYARKGMSERTTVLSIFAAMGPRAADRIGTLLPLASTLPPDQASVVADALVRVGGEGVAAYMADRLPKADPTELGIWLDGVGAHFGGARTLLAPLAELSKSPTDATAARALAAVARIDAKVEDDTTRRVLANGLADPRPAVQLAATKAAGSLAVIPDDLLLALARARESADGEVKAAATTAIASAWRLGAAAKPLVPALASIAADDDVAKATPDLVVGALRSLAAADATDTRARGAFERTLTSATSTPDMRRAALGGLSHVTDPTPAEKAAVAALESDRTVAPLVRALLARRVWR